MLLAPSSSICSFALLAIPSLIASSQITLATPMKIPKIVSMDRIGCMSKVLSPILISRNRIFKSEGRVSREAADSNASVEIAMAGGFILVSDSITPSRSRTTRRALSATSCSCVTMTIVAPSSFRRSNNSRISSVVTESRLPVASSAKINSGRFTRLRAMPARCC